MPSEAIRRYVGINPPPKNMVIANKTVIGFLKTKSLIEREYATQEVNNKVNNVFPAAYTMVIR